jgi:hypothetical protein
MTGALTPPRTLSPKLRGLSWALRLLVAIILLQTLTFKFTGAPESVHIFSTLGLEPWGRYASGGAELLAAVLMLLPGTEFFGAALALMVISGAIVSHLTRLGIVVQDDGGLLFGLALIVAAASLTLVFLHRPRPTPASS